jgi:hypothetical protein
MRQADKLTLLIATAVASIAFTTSGANAQTFEPNTNRPGSDYRVIDLSSADSQLCQQACLGDDVCRAWSYVQPGLQGPTARCWLKNAVPTPMTADCCTSGIKGNAAANPAAPASAPANTASADQSNANGDDQPDDVDLPGDDDGPGGSGGRRRGLKLRPNPNGNPNGIKLRPRDGGNPNGQQVANAGPGTPSPQTMPPNAGCPQPASSSQDQQFCMRVRSPDGQTVGITFSGPNLSPQVQPVAIKYCLSGGSLNGKCGQMTITNTTEQICMNGSNTGTLPLDASAGLIDPSNPNAPPET